MKFVIRRNGYPCHIRTMQNAGTKIRASSAPCITRISVPAYYKLHMGHGIPCPPYTFCIWGTEFCAHVLHGSYGAINSVPAFRTVHLGHEVSCPLNTRCERGTEIGDRNKHSTYGPRISVPANIEHHMGHESYGVRNFVPTLCMV